MTSLAQAPIKPLSNQKRPFLGVILCLCAGSALVTLSFFVLKPEAASLTWFHSRGWTKTPCVITLHQVMTHESRRGPLREFEVRYAYEFGGSPHVSSRIQFGRTHYFLRRGLNDTALYPTGERTICYVNPDNPEEAVLDRSFPHSLFPSLFTSAIMLAFGVAFLAMAPVTLWFGTRPPQYVPARRNNQPSPTVRNPSIVAGLPRLKLRRETTGRWHLRPDLHQGRALSLGQTGFYVILLIAGATYLLTDRKTDLNEGSPLALIIMLILYFLIAACLLAFDVRRTLRRVRPRLWIDAPSLQPGQSAQLLYEFPARAGSMQRWTMKLLMIEEVSFLASKSNPPRLTHVYPAEVLAAHRVDEGEPFIRGVVPVTIPAHAMHTFESARNRIDWLILVEIEGLPARANLTQYHLPVVPQSPLPAGAL